jgi:hypothetical protein
MFLSRERHSLFVNCINDAARIQIHLTGPLFFSADCAEPRSAFTIISQARICSATRRKVHGVEDNRRVSNGDQVSRVAALAMRRGKSVDFTGYWQRHIAD